MKKKGLLLFILLIMACCCLPVLLVGAGSVLVVANPFEKADAAVILSGGELERVDTAAILYHNQSVNNVILTETGNTVRNLNATYTKLLKEQLRLQKVPDNAVLVTDGISTSTYAEANAVKDLLYKVNLTSVIVVTDPYHTFRTRMVFREVFSGSEKNFSRNSH